MIEFRDVSKIYPGNKVAAQDINLEFNDGEFIVFIGTSGSGKTTCMRMINRMIEPTGGSILIDGEDIMSMNPVDLRRRIGYVIQQIGLMPHMTIYENIILVPKLLKWDEAKMQTTAKELISKVNLDESYLDRYPAELSGGQQQRIGVIRALAADQDIILMDEPFGALDPITRDALQELIKKLQREMGKTVIFVTHDMDEALALADRIVIMDEGKVIQFDTPENILQYPADEYVESILGEERLNQARSAMKTVDEIMIKNPISINVNDSVRQAARVMRNSRVDSLFVIDDNNVIQGVLDIFDIEKIGRRSAQVKDIMKDAQYIHDDTRIRDAIYSIMTLGYKNLPVVDKDYKLVGLVTRASIVESIYSGIWGNEGSNVSETVQSTENN
ncbi:MAG: betaine/proline/choline family ABC transporter ATP-binding protein [Tissierellia bacterium]|nr:betaine/proline/choline family ABC transporter ATP-binding protein [Tissierellia bacterium]